MMDETIILQDDTVSAPADDLQSDLGFSETASEEPEQPLVSPVPTPVPTQALTEIVLAPESMDELKAIASDMAHVNLFSSCLVSGALIGVLLLRLSR